MAELEDFTDEQRREWTKYVAAERIYIGGALAFNTGDPVPASHVDRKDAPVNKAQVNAVDAKKTDAS